VRADEVLHPDERQGLCCGGYKAKAAEGEDSRKWRGTVVSGAAKAAKGKYSCTWRGKR